MLSSLHIRNLAVIEQLDLELTAGLTVLTGETGTGKSILVDALGLALGDRTDSGIVRHGSPRTEVSAVFDLAALPDTAQWLVDNALDSDGECQIRRTVGSDGRSKGFINGQTVTLAQLRQLGAQLLDIHGQHEHQSLLQRDEQRRLLDGVADHRALLDAVADGYRQWRGLRDEYQALRNEADGRDDALELLRFQVEELAVLNLDSGAVARIEGDHRRLSHADQLLAGCRSALEQLDDGEQPLTLQLAQCSAALATLSRHDSALSGICEQLDSAQIHITEAAGELRRHLDALELDPAYLQQLEQQLRQLHDLSRKHRVAAAELPALLMRLQERLQRLEQAETRLATLDDEIARAAAAYRAAASVLHASRQQAAQHLAQQVSANMQTLGMPGSRFDITLTTLANEQFTASGTDQIEFLICTNPGQPAKPLAKIASGGELSRISLAIQVITARQTAVPTLIFDEVDVGIGGRIAEIVGQKLRKLGQVRQVLCVTHQPQVAALGHHHLQVIKTSDGEQTATQVTLLDARQRREEIARMLGGIEITAQTRAHAAEMLARSMQDKPVTA
ncbi:MAG: DNA repair protein RecN [Gammaproteobacteria bacterium]|nr:DNA repair protein RecN [Gammaproteobacteria bacterium]